MHTKGMLLRTFLCMKQICEKMNFRGARAEIKISLTIFPSLVGGAGVCIHSFHLGAIFEISRGKFWFKHS